jgi:hypothetical protein
MPSYVVTTEKYLLMIGDTSIVVHLRIRGQMVNNKILLKKTKRNVVSRKGIL